LNGGLRVLKPTKLTPGLAVLSNGNQGLLFPSVSTGKTTDPGKDVGDGIAVAVTVGSGVNVGGIGDGVKVDGTAVGTGVEAGAHPLNKTISTTNTSNTD
jgi:hypothetical protein